MGPSSFKIIRLLAKEFLLGSLVILSLKLVLLRFLCVLFLVLNCLQVDGDAILLDCRQRQGLVLLHNITARSLLLSFALAGRREFTR